MDFSPQQDAALQAVSAWLRDPAKPFFYLGGYAGTGKTTLARHLAADVGNALFATFTGKAADVMRSKGCANATTIHKLIYVPKGKSTARLQKMQDQRDMAAAAKDEALVEQLTEQIRAEVLELKSPGFELNPVSTASTASLIVIDECSMVNAQMAEDLLSFNVPVLVLGDPAQLPPVFGAGAFTNGDPDFMLTEIHRQARESGVLRLATEIREGGAPQIGTDYGGQARIISRQQVDPEAMPHYDQILCGRNKTRRAINRRVRELLGIESEMPVRGDKLVCLRNNHDIGLLNGQQWNVFDTFDVDEFKIGLMIGRDEVPEFAVDTWRCYFLGEELDRFEHSNDTQEFEFGYGLTVHKSQGSEWSRVAIFDEAWCFRNDAAKWLYTALTRASDEVLLIR